MVALMSCQNGNGGLILSKSVRQIWPVPKKRPNHKTPVKKANSLQLCSLAVCLLAAASTQTTPAIVQSPVLAREQTSATLCFKSNQNTIDIYSHISNT